MNYDYHQTLNPQKALIWRIVHRDNIPWILDNGLHCGVTVHPTTIDLTQKHLTAKDCKRICLSKVAALILLPGSLDDDPLVVIRPQDNHRDSHRVVCRWSISSG